MNLFPVKYLHFFKLFININMFCICSSHLENISLSLSVCVVKYLQMSSHSFFRRWKMPSLIWILGYWRSHMDPNQMNKEDMGELTLLLLLWNSSVLAALCAGTLAWWRSTVENVPFSSNFFDFQGQLLPNILFYRRKVKPLSSFSSTCSYVGQMFINFEAPDPRLLFYFWILVIYQWFITSQLYMSLLWLSLNSYWAYHFLTCTWSLMVDYVVVDLMFWYDLFFRIFVIRVFCLFPLSINIFSRYSWQYGDSQARFIFLRISNFGPF